jgi:hypothetical protein
MRSAFYSTFTITDYFTASVIWAAEQSILKSSSQPRRTPINWWKKNAEMQSLIARGLYRYSDETQHKKTLSTSRKHVPKQRDILWTSKKASWQRFVSSISRSTAFKFVWDRL